MKQNDSILQQLKQMFVYDSKPNEFEPIKTSTKTVKRLVKVPKKELDKVETEEKMENSLSTKDKPSKVHTQDNKKVSPFMQQLSLKEGILFSEIIAKPRCKNRYQRRNRH